MRLRPYRSSDAEHVVKWVENERTNALWCAGKIVFPATAHAFEEVRRAGEKEWGISGFTATEDDGEPVGYFHMSIHNKNNSSFMGFVIVDSGCRGKGYGREMLRLAKSYAFEIANVDSIRLAVFDCNDAAVNCYRKSGFEIAEHIEDAFCFQSEQWGRYIMECRR